MLHIVTFLIKLTSYISYDFNYLSNLIQKLFKFQIYLFTI